MNLLVYAHRRDTSHHAAALAWLDDVINSQSAYAVSELVLSSFVRIVTSPRIFERPSDLEEALAVCHELRSQPNAVLIRPGARHWEIFVGLCEATEARGNIVADAYLAALAIEYGCVWMTADRDFARFPKLRWSNPLT